MNVTPSKILLGLSLAAYGYCSWDHLFAAKLADAAPVKAPALTPAIANRAVPFKMDKDPFNSVPFGQTLAAGAPLPIEPGKDLGDLKLNGVLVTFADRAAVLNGKSLHEGETTQTSSGATIRVKKIGVGYCIIEGGGQIVMLKIDDDKNADAAPKPGGAAAISGGSGPAPGHPYVAKDKMPQKKG